VERRRDDGAGFELVAVPLEICWTHVNRDRLAETEVEMGLVDSVEGLAFTCIVC
jgi:hypothetical protein